MSERDYVIGDIGFGPAWSDGLYEEMDNAGICTACGLKMTLVRPGKAQCDYCELGEAYDRAQAEIRQLTAELDEAREAVKLAASQLSDQTFELRQQLGKAKQERDEAREDAKEAKRLIMQWKQLMHEWSKEAAK